MNAPDNLPSWHLIAERAYAIFVQSGRKEGRDLENWLQAEEELKAAIRELPHDLSTHPPHQSEQGHVLKSFSDDGQSTLDSQKAAQNEGQAVSGKDGGLRGDKKSGKAGERTRAPGNREGIQEVAHRVMGSRQSKRTVERSNQRRQPKRGPSSQKPVE